MHLRYAPLLVLVAVACGEPEPWVDWGDAALGRHDAQAPLEDAALEGEDVGVEGEDAGVEAEDAGVDAEDAAVEDASLPDAGLAADAGAQADAGAGPDAGAAPGRDAGPGDAGGPAPGRDAGSFDAGPSSARQTARPTGTVTGQTHGYYEYLPPGYDDGGEHPLLVFWHGIGENGSGSATDLPKVLKNGPPKIINANKWPATRPFVVLSPQHPGGGCPGAAEIRNFISFALGQYAIDATRVYLTGLSCGAIGSWNYLGSYTNEQVAAAVLIAGDGRNAWTKQGCNLGRVAIWGFHGDADETVTEEKTIVPMTNLIACPEPPRLDARLTVYPGVGHDSWTRTYDLSAGHDIYSWLLQFSK